MPAGRNADFLGPLRDQASKVLKQLEARIQQLESEIEHLRGQAEAWRHAVGGKIATSLGLGKAPARRGRPPGSKGRPGKGKRVKWDDVLASVPKRFGVQDVMKHPGAAAKGRAQVYPALNRWEATKRIKRVEQGVYEKLVSGASASSTKAPAKRRSGKKSPISTKAVTGASRTASRKAAS